MSDAGRGNFLTHRPEFYLLFPMCVALIISPTTLTYTGAHELKPSQPSCTSKTQTWHHRPGLYSLMRPSAIYSSIKYHIFQGSVQTSSMAAFLFSFMPSSYSIKLILNPTKCSATSISTHGYYCIYLLPCVHWLSSKLLVISIKSYCVSLHPQSRAKCPTPKEHWISILKYL